MTVDLTTLFPRELDTPKFREAWCEWVQFRRERRLSAYKPLGLKRALGMLAEWGEADAIQAIHTSMAQNWQGLFKPKETAKDAKPKSNEKRRAGWL